MKYELGQIVYVKTDPKQLENQIVARRQFIGGTITYTVGFNGGYYDVYEGELSEDIDTIKKLENN